jgi:hypothetical protein
LVKEKKEAVLAELSGDVEKKTDIGRDILSLIGKHTLIPTRKD